MRPPPISQALWLLAFCGQRPERPPSSRFVFMNTETFEEMRIPKAPLPPSPTRCVHLL